MDCIGCKYFSDGNKGHCNCFNCSVMQSKKVCAEFDNRTEY